MEVENGHENAQSNSGDDSNGQNTVTNGHTQWDPDWAWSTLYKCKYNLFMHLLIYITQYYLIFLQMSYF